MPDRISTLAGARRRVRSVLLALALLLAGTLGAATAAQADTIAAGFGHTCAVHKTGAVSCWGAGTFGQLGNGSTIDSSTPVTVSGLTDATAIATGYVHTCALRAGGTVVCWGSTASGRLGDGTTSNSGIRATPVPVIGVSGAIAIASGHYHTCALRADHTIWCWGGGGQGALGNGASVNQSTAVQVTGIADATAIAAGSDGTCALRGSGTVSCWGSADYLAIDGDPWTSHHTPVNGINGVTDAVALSMGNRHACVLSSGGFVNCWGTSRYFPNEYIHDGVSLASGYEHECAVRTDATVACWGVADGGRLGAGPSVPYANAIAVAGSANAVAVAGGQTHTCAVRGDGSVICWGSGRSGVLGNGTTKSSLSPVLVTGLTDIAPRTPMPASGPPPAKLAVTAPAVSFGDLWFGKPVARTIRVTNTGGRTATGVRKFVSSAPDDEPLLAPKTLAPGASWDVVVSLGATVRGPITASMMFGSTNAGTQYVTLSGTGRSPVAKLSTKALDFGAVRQGTAATRTITVSNVGDGKLTLTGYPIIEGASAADYAWTGALGALSPGQSTVFTVTFTPAAGGARPATIRFTPKSGAVALTGSGA